MKTLKTLSEKIVHSLIISIVCITALHSAISNATINSEHATRIALPQNTSVQPLSSRLGKHVAAGLRVLNTLAQLNQMQHDAALLEYNLAKLLFTNDRGSRHIGRCAHQSIRIATLLESVLSFYGGAKPSDKLGVAGKLGYGMAQLMSMIAFVTMYNYSTAKCALIKGCTKKKHLCGRLRTGNATYAEYMIALGTTYSFAVTIATLASHGYRNIKEAYEAYTKKQKQNNTSVKKHPAPAIV